MSFIFIAGFKDQGRYVYHYEAWLNPAKIPYFEGHIANLYMNGTLQIDFARNNEAFLKVFSFISFCFIHYILYRFRHSFIRFK